MILIKKKNSGLVDQERAILLQSMRAGKHFEVITLLWTLAPKKTQR